MTIGRVIFLTHFFTPPRSIIFTMSSPTKTPYSSEINVTLLKNMRAILSGKDTV